jgi:two-component system LytT family sensor kinase
MHKVVRHLLFWIAYVLFKVYLNVTSDVNAIDTGISWESLVVTLEVQLAWLVIKVPVVYALFFLIDQYLSGLRSLLFCSLAALALFVIAPPAMSLVNQRIISTWIYGLPPSPLELHTGSVLYFFFMLLSVAGIASSLKLARRQWQSRVYEQQLKREKAEAELKFLQAQIHPHFLFNTLNSIYSLARKKEDVTADAVLKLSQLMRFMLYEASRPLIPLSREIEVVRDYVELEKLRYGARLKLTMNVQVDSPTRQITPLILLHFVENAFKHGASESRSDTTIRIHILEKDGQLNTTISNSHEKKTSTPETGIGLKNIRRQLDLLYPHHQLTVEETTDQFTVNLQLTLPI